MMQIWRFKKLVGQFGRRTQISTDNLHEQSMVICIVSSTNGSFIAVI